MSSFAPALGAAGPASALASRLTLPLFTAALFLSALLLFGVQPMFTKMVLPVLGGTPAVWSVAMVFFQALLLLGYLYAHVLTRRLGIRAAAAAHLALMASAFLAMPVAVAAGWGKPPASGEALWLLGLFAASVGLPFFALAGNGPLLQAWFARSGHTQAKDPYFLYAASNIGSFGALIAYPLAIEPFLTLRSQSEVWTVGFGGLGLLIAACAVLVACQPASSLDAARTQTVEDETSAPTWRERLAWIGLSFVPSGLLVAVTAHISTDIAAAPLLWVAPLALFLLTFVLAFRDRPVIGGDVLKRLQVWGTALAFLSLTNVWLSVGLTAHLGLFFINAMMCHTALYRRRPPASSLTDFYLCMSIGGVLGGVFCGLLAPHVFSTVLEYPLLLIAALFCQPGFFGADRTSWFKEAGRGLATCAVAVAGGFVLAKTAAPVDQVRLVLMAVFAAVMMIVWRTPTQVAPLAVTVAVIATVFSAALVERETLRSFFGVHKIGRTHDGRFMTLAHGTTLHGAIRLKNDDGTPATGRPEPTTYYTYEGAIGTAIAAVREAQGGTLSSAAAVGLGSGSLSCHVQPSEAWTFFEIDPEVLRIAQDGRYFRFLKDCAPNVPVVLGDARLTLADQPGGKSLIVVDAFSSDAIPTHLITREAIGLYMTKLAPDGAIVFHISNRHLDLSRILSRTAAEHGLVTYVLHETEEEPMDNRYRTPSVVAAVARHPSHLGRLAAPSGWRRIEPELLRRPWTDDFSNLIEAIIDKNRSP
jgi:hypothetical protein